MEPTTRMPMIFNRMHEVQEAEHSATEEERKNEKRNRTPIDPEILLTFDQIKQIRLFDQIFTKCEKNSFLLR